MAASVHHRDGPDRPSGRPAGSDDALLKHVAQALQAQFGINHATLHVEAAGMAA